MKTDQPQVIHLADYLSPAFAVESLHLTFELSPNQTVVTAISQLSRKGEGGLELQGEKLELLSISIDDNPLDANQYKVDDEALNIASVPDKFELTIKTQIDPANNTALEGLYQSSGNFCTQCEAEGFRKITYFFDRPDVLTTYTTKIIAERALYPVLLSNGNLIEEGELENGMHFATWRDPHPKPCYLFALVAGDLAFVQDSFKTKSGRDVDLRIYVEKHNIDKCDHAMQSLINSMRWDEERFDLEYDLDIYMIVAVDDFNMGAMENKGLNVFNSKFVLAKPESATDVDYQGIEGVIGHEYFHNWTGNRVTCRDWFQLSLKEGLTVFRDQEFSSDMASRAIKRIEDVRLLRTHQFAEDAGPMAHPIRPDSYIEINNFYTLTVYEKGAEVIRMQHTLLGEEGFQKGMKLYFERHDGQAVTCDDFVAAMADANQFDMSAFKNWYTQAGTPVLDVSESYDETNKTYTLKFKQHTPDTPNQTDKNPVHIPLKMALLDSAGDEIVLNTPGYESSKELVIDIKSEQQEFVFSGVDSHPIPSLLRGFSAPIKLRYPYSREQLLFLFAKDQDSFNRWEASQNLALSIVHELLGDIEDGRELSLDPLFIEAFQDALYDNEQDKALIAAALTLPSERYIAETVSVINPDHIHQVREFMITTLANQLKSAFLEIYHENNAQEEYQPDPQSIAERSLKNLCLSYLNRAKGNDAFELSLAQLDESNNMTDTLASLSMIVEHTGQSRDDVLSSFYKKWSDDAQVLDKWFSVQALSGADDTLERVKALMAHEKFALTNPNKVRALVGAFCMNNPVGFHRKDGDGYQLLADVVIKLDAINPQVAARMTGAFNAWRRYTPDRRTLMQSQLERILQTSDLSRDVFEIASKALAVN